MLALSTVPATAQNEIGLPFTKAYGWTDYNASPENWTITQDSLGIMYFGNLNGVLEFDGSTWRLTPLPNRTYVRALVTDSNGTVWVGGEDEIGFLDHSAIGRTEYVSLIEKVRPEERNFGTVFQAITTPGGVYFLTNYYVFRWDGETLASWKIDKETLIISYIDGDVYLVVFDSGLFRLNEREFELVAGGERFADTPIYAMLPYGDGRVVLCTRNEGLWLYDPRSPHNDSRFAPFRTEADSLLQAGRVYVPGAALPNGRFVLGTRAAGVVVIDRSGRLLSHLDTETGLAGNSVGYVYVDRAGNVWLAHRRGITRIELAKPLSYFNERLGLRAQATSIARYNGTLYVGTMDGVYVLNTESHRFERIQGLSGQIAALSTVDDDLLAIHQGGKMLFRLSGNRFVAIKEARFPTNDWDLHRWKQNPDYLLVGRDNGLSAVKRFDGGWRHAESVEQLDALVRSIAEGRSGDLWLGTTDGKLVRVKPDGATQPLRNATISTFGAPDGIPGGQVFVFSIGGELFLTATGGRILRINEDADSNSPVVSSDDRFDAALSDNPLSMPVIREDTGGQIWLAQEFGIPAVMRKNENGHYDVVSSSLGGLLETQIIDIVPEANGIAWLMGLEKLVRYDRSREVSAPVTPRPLLRMIAAGSETLSFGSSEIGDIRLPHDSEALHFAYATPPRDDVLFRTRLDGADGTWTPWSASSRSDYAALGPGRFTFRVQALGSDGDPGPESSVVFTILPPWWRSIWALLCYSVLLLGAVAALYRYRQNQLRLRHVVEIQRLEAENLRKLDLEKSRFFANVSHEFRTPLTLTMGPLDDVLDGEYGSVSEDVKEQLSLARRSAGRVLGLINQILDLARVEAGRLNIQTSPVEIGAFISELTLPFRQVAVSKRIAFEIRLPQEPTDVYLDRLQFEKVLVNLLSNAFKFTPSGGEVSIETSANSEYLEVRVQDSGRGISSDALPHIFDRFFRADESSGPFQPGTGIGLALSKELVELHGGTIDVQSKYGEGSVFTVKLRRGRNHLGDDQVVDRLNATENERPPAKQEDDAVNSDGITDKRASDADADATADQTVVLVVEDNADIRTYITRHLAQTYRVEQSDNGASGLAMARELLPDLIISDVMMPEMDGFALCKALKADPETDFIPVVLLTARADQSDKLEGLDLQADDYLTKPFDPAELLARVHNLIESRRRLRVRFAQGEPGPLVALHPTTVDVSSADAVFLERVRSKVEAGLADDTLSVDMLAEAIGISRSQLHRRLKSLIGKAPSDVIREMRLERAAQLLAARAGTVSEVAYAVGFRSVAHFSTAFLQQYGCRPSAYPTAIDVE